MARHRRAPPHSRGGGARDSAGIRDADRGRAFRAELRRDRIDDPAGGARQVAAIVAGGFCRAHCRGRPATRHQCPPQAGRRRGVGMVRVLLLVIALAAAGVPLRASAQTGIVPAPPYYAMSPGISPASPVQQQVLENYRIQLQQTQREMLQQNPSGLGREQIEVTHQLNLYNARPPTTYTAPSPAPSRAPPEAYYLAPPVVDPAPHPTRR